MLRRDVQQAVADGKFHVYAIETVDQALELLTGMPSGERNEQGDYAPDTLNALVERRLVELVELHRKYSGSDDSPTDDKDKT